MVLHLWPVVEAHRDGEAGEARGGQRGLRLHNRRPVGEEEGKISGHLLEAAGPLGVLPDERSDRGHLDIFGYLLPALSVVCLFISLC